MKLHDQPKRVNIQMPWTDGIISLAGLDISFSKLRSFGDLDSWQSENSQSSKLHASHSSRQDHSFA